MTYSPEQYTVYYTTNSSGCPADSDEGYIKSVTVYGLNYTDFFIIRDQQYNVALTNLYPYTVYCYRVVATNTEGRNESILRIFGTYEASEYMYTVCIFCTQINFWIIGPSGPPQNITFFVSSYSITLFWSPPIVSQQNGVITRYFITCISKFSIVNRNTSNTSLKITGLEPFTNYTCILNAATVVGDGPSTLIQIMTSMYSK